MRRTSDSLRAGDGYRVKEGSKRGGGEIEGRSQRLDSESTLLGSRLHSLVGLQATRRLHVATFCDETKGLISVHAGQPSDPHLATTMMPSRAVVCNAAPVDDVPRNPRSNIFNVKGVSVRLPPPPPRAVPLPACQSACPTRDTRRVHSEAGK